MCIYTFNELLLFYDALIELSIVNSIYMYTCTCISQLFVNYFLLFEALMEDWRVVKWVVSWNKVFIIIIIIIVIIIT